jgi:uncharacterized protein (DUF302 family)
MQNRLAFEVTLFEPLDRAVARLTEELSVEGFGVLTRIDVRDIFARKLNLEFRPYTILGACNPNLAHLAITARADAGLLLPCSITAEEIAQGHTMVRIGNPVAFLAVGDLAENPMLQRVAAEARGRLERVADRLALSSLQVV